MGTPYAHDTDVPIGKTRAEIEMLLRRWDCNGVQWTDDFRRHAATLRFRWTYEGTDYAARLEIRLPGDDQLRAEFRRPPTADQLQARREQRFRSLHRVLLLTIKAQLNAVDIGLATAVETFLPYLEQADGHTVAEILVPRLRDLSRVLLLEGG